MTAPFSFFQDRLAAAADDATRRALLAEIGVWRAQRLTDIPAQRTASYALSSLYTALGEAVPAVSEAGQLVALCRVPPNPPGEELQLAEQHLARVRRTFGQPAPRPERPDRPERSDRPERRPAPARQASSDRDVRRDAPVSRGQDSMTDAVAAVRAGRFDDARRLVGDLRRDRVALARTWVSLAEALARPGKDRDAALRALESDLLARLTGGPVRAAEPTRPAPTPRAPVASASGLDDVLAPPKPERGERAERAPRATPERDAKVADLLVRIAAEPAAADGLAAAALREHVAAEGRQAVAPWLIGTTGLALATTDGVDTRAAIAELGDAWAVTAYGEAPFGLLVDALRAALAAGYTFVGLRRGVLRRGGPSGRETWTLRLAKDGEERVIALPAADDAPPAQVAERLVVRVAELCPRVVLVAGAGQEALAAAATAVGVTVVADLSAAVAALDTLAPHEVGAADPVRTPQPVARAERPERAERAPRPSSVELDAEVSAAFSDAPRDAAAWAPLLSRYDRGFKAFAAIRVPLEQLAPADVDARLAPFLAALHDTAPPAVRWAEGIAVVVRHLVAVPDGAVGALVSADDAVAARYGGRTALDLADLARTLGGAGWAVHRVLLGVARREERAQPGLVELGRHVEGLTRLVVRRGDQGGEVLWVDAPSPEARAALPLVLLTPGTRVVVTRPSTELQLFGPVSVIRWSDEGRGELLTAVDRWPAARPDDEA